MQTQLQFMSRRSPQIWSTCAPFKVKITQTSEIRPVSVNRTHDLIFRERSAGVRAVTFVLKPSS
jgi:hypothetical protein